MLAMFLVRACELLKTGLLNTRLMCLLLGPVFESLPRVDELSCKQGNTFPSLVCWLQNAPGGACEALLEWWVALSSL